jgi:hypothetical protein
MLTYAAGKGSGDISYTEEEDGKGEAGVEKELEKGKGVEKELEKGKGKGAMVVRTYADVCLRMGRMLTYADYADGCGAGERKGQGGYGGEDALTYADVCGRMLTCADVCCADVC